MERRIESWLMDMDGVLVREELPVPGADRFIAALRERDTPFLVLTNNSMYTRRDLAARLAVSGLHIPEERIWTSALATADFLHDQRPHGSAFVIGEAGLLTALHEAGYTLTERAPDYVVIGETRTYSFERITRAIRLIAEGARFIATNPDATGPSPEGPRGGERSPMAVQDEVAVIYAATNGFVDRVEADTVPDFDAKLVERLHAAIPEVMDRIGDGDWSDDTQNALHETTAEFARDYGYDLDEEGQPLSDDEAIREAVEA
jgi:hypothetical protein